MWLLVLYIMGMMVYYMVGRVRFSKSSKGRILFSLSLHYRSVVVHTQRNLGGGTCVRGRFALGVTPQQNISYVIRSNGSGE
jgi:hypothetical protein